MTPRTTPRTRRLGDVDSALTVLATAAREDLALPSFTTILAEHQSAGRGRSGREWLDDGSALLAAILVRVADALLSRTTLLAGIALAHALEARGLTPRLKWPNDVLIEGRKACGILCEHIAADPDSGEHLVGIGIGVNLGSFPKAASPIAGAVPLAEGETAEDARESILAAILQALPRILENPSEDWRGAYVSRLIGAALFQTAGLTEVFRDQRVPGNASLDCLDPEMRGFAPLVWTRRPLSLAASPARAGVLTSLGFGHVAALVALAHPSAFETRLATERGEKAAAQWRSRATSRLASGRARLERAMIGHDALYEPVEDRRLPARGAHEAEAAMLLDPSTRLGADGVYGTARATSNPTTSDSASSASGSDSRGDRA